MKKILFLLAVLLMIIACYVPILRSTFSVYTTPSPTNLPALSTATTTMTNALQCIVTATNLNLRKKPSTSAPVAVVLSNGNVVTIDQNTPAQGRWQRVFYDDLVGWINMNYCY